MIETIKVAINHPRGYKIINKSDFDPDIHKEFKIVKKRIPRKKKSE